MAEGAWAVTKDGQVTWCTAPPEKRGKGNCPHVDHQRVEDGETTDEFLSRTAKQQKNVELDVNEEPHEITQDEIDSIASKLDSIVGIKLTEENLNEVLNSLTPDQMQQVTEIGFKAAPMFGLPFSDEDYDQEVINTQMYFANLPDYGIGGNRSSIAQMFDKIGESPMNNGESMDVEHSYKEGLTPNEYFVGLPVRLSLLQNATATAYETQPCYNPSHNAMPRHGRAA
ncbi:hypothetical protein [Adlercreutzia sp. ZJ154]|uniref:hypothetical protein n=1 Tax=Adlercreutzia sp. ZJ154 TaxID=2709790 RepID=UPI0013EB6120|nr:hypothetical protein [Adlercreutzia sp. ZJ154]